MVKIVFWVLELKNIYIACFMVYVGALCLEKCVDSKYYLFSTSSVIQMVNGWPMS